MPARAEGPVAGLVLAAGASRRLGRAKQLLPFGDATLLDATLAQARACRFDQLICALGPHEHEIRGMVDLRGVEVVRAAAPAQGCSSSIAAAMPVLDGRCAVLVVLLGDQPGVSPRAVGALLAGRGGADVAVCRYDDGLGHPLAFTRERFAALAQLRGDRAVWKLVEAGATEVPVEGPVPRDVDTWADYEALLASVAAP